MKAAWPAFREFAGIGILRKQVPVLGACYPRV